jgi:hypothetical protein
MTLKEWVFLVWSTETLYNGHPAGDDVRALLNRIGAAYGFNVEDAFENYAVPQSETVAEFELKPKTYV